MPKSRLASPRGALRTFRPVFHFPVSPFVKQNGDRAKSCKRKGIPYEPRYNRTEDSMICVTCAAESRKMMCCRGCRVAYYCSAACQRKDWPSHKAYCDPDYGLPKGTQGIEESIYSYEETSNPAPMEGLPAGFVCDALDLR